MTETAQEFVAPSAINQVVSREAAPQAIEQLRADRLNNRIGEADYFKRLDYLHSVASSDPSKDAPAPPKAHETLEERLERDYSEHMTPPATPEQYANLAVPDVAGFS